MKDDLQKEIDEELARAVFHDPREYATAVDWHMSFWASLIAAHKLGVPIDKRHIAALLRRGESIPPEAQAFLAEAYFDPQTPKGRGAPKKPDFLKEQDQTKAAEAFVDEVNGLRRSGMTLRAALNEYARVHHGPAGNEERREKRYESLKRRYTSARSLLRDHWTTVKEQSEDTLRLFGSHDASINKLEQMIAEKIAEYSSKK
jgi:hypothetical protein